MSSVERLQSEKRGICGLKGELCRDVLIAIFNDFSGGRGSDPESIMEPDAGSDLGGLL